VQLLLKKRKGLLIALNTLHVADIQYLHSHSCLVMPRLSPRRDNFLLLALHMHELEGYLGILPFYGAALYLVALFVQKNARGIFPL